MRRVSLIAAALMLVTVLLLPKTQAGNTASASPKWVYDYHAFVPIGEDAVLLRSDRQVLFFLASAQSAAFENWRQIIVDGNHSLTLRADGSPVRQYPRFIDFRVTISARQKDIPELQPFAVEFGNHAIQNLDDFLLSLRFRVKIFHGLQATVLEPKIIKLIGVPADVPYDERIFRLSFDLGEVPVEDRIVLEVLSPEGERLTKFHLDM